MRNIINNKQCFYTMVLLQVLKTQILRTAHDDLGHIGTTRTYMLVCRLYCWKGMMTSINKYIKQCMTCQKRNVQVGKYAQLHFSTPRLQFISMDFIGPFDPSSNGHHYVLTVICMLTGCMICIPLKIKAASEVAQAYIDEIYTQFEGSMKILSGNGKEFKNQLLTDIGTWLGVEHRAYSPPYHSQSNERIKGFHNSSKHACLNMYQSFLSGIK